MSDERRTIITDTDRVEWLLRYGSPIQIDGGPIGSREQVDAQIRKSQMQIGRAWTSVKQPDTEPKDKEFEAQPEPVAPKRMNDVPGGTLLARSAELSMLSAANRELAIVIGDLRLRRYS